MPLPRLIPDATSKPVKIQETAFSYDLMGRYVCCSWDEVQNNGGDPFDVVVIGAGMFGGYIAEKLYRFGEETGQRILVLDAGSFLSSTHLQNLPKIGVGVPDPTKFPPVTDNDKDPGPQSIVWGYPWHSNQRFPGLAYCVGGRSIFWGGWAPRMTAQDLAPWPQAVRDFLDANYETVEKEIGVKPATDYISGPLYKALLDAFRAAAPAGFVVDEAPLAVQGKAEDSGLFAFDKYSSNYLLIDAIREDVGRRWRDDIDAWRRFMLLPRTHVMRLLTAGGKVTGAEVYVNGQPQTIKAPLISDNCAFILAASTIESTRLALESFPTPEMGSNLMAHLRTNLTVRIKRSQFPTLPPNPLDLETAALIVRGTSSNNRRFHHQVTGAAIQGPNPEQNLFTTIPDIDLLNNIRANQNPEWIVLTLRGIGEMAGRTDARPGDAQKSWMNLTFDDPKQKDRGMRRAWVNLEAAPDDMTTWNEMDQAALDLAFKIAGSNADNIRYLVGGTWEKNAPGIGFGRDLIGSTHHEAGTLRMGAPGSSVTDGDGRFHHVENAYVAGPALFPTMGSANPSLTGMTLARRTASAVLKKLTPEPSAEFRPLFTGSLAGWQVAGGGNFITLFGSIIEAQPGGPGLGLLWYKREVFRNFVLKVDWLSFDPSKDNSGVFIRFPSLNASDPANDWRLPVDRGYEIQIDDTGFYPEENRFGDPLHQTGAVYTLCASSHVASKGAGQWNTFEIEAGASEIKVTLNGQLVTTCPVVKGRPAAGHIGLQSHTGKVQFRNMLIRSLPD